MDLLIDWLTFDIKSYPPFISDFDVFTYIYLRGDFDEITGDGKTNCKTLFWSDPREFHGIFKIRYKGIYTVEL